MCGSVDLEGCPHFVTFLVNKINLGSPCRASNAPTTAPRGRLPLAHAACVVLGRPRRCVPARLQLVAQKGVSPARVATAGEYA